MTENKQDINSISFAIEGVYRKFRPQSVILASGEDAVDFVQGQVTQDISALKRGEAAYGFLLTQKGRVLGDVVVVHENVESLRLVSWSLAARELSDRLESYIIADDVELVDETANWNGWQLAGSKGVSWGQAWVAQAGADAMGWSEFNPLPSESFRLLTRNVPTWPDELQAAAAEDFERVRVAAGIPRVPDDMGPTEFPQEAGQEKVGVSFKKGCYLGQEVMARLATTGRIRRRLCRVSGEGEPPAATHTALKQNERVVGQLRSRVSVGEHGWRGLGLINLAHYDPEQEVQVVEGRSVKVGEPI